VRQVGAESVILIVAGLGCALLLAYIGSDALLAVLSQAFRGFSLSAGPSVGVMAFTSGPALTALLFGVPRH
jgi:hypothetical protein